MDSIPSGLIDGIYIYCCSIPPRVGVIDVSTMPFSGVSLAVVGVTRWKFPSNHIANARAREFEPLLFSDFESGAEVSRVDNRGSDSARLGPDFCTVR